MRCQELQTIGNDADRRRVMIPARPVLWSILLHGLVISMFLIGGGTGLRYASSGELLSVRLLADNGQESLDSALPDSNVSNSAVENVANQSALSSTPVRKMWEAPDLQTWSEEGYLPQEFLSRAAFPVDDIDLQDISSPEEGAFQMYLWIDSRGKVTRVDVQDSKVAAWFVDQIVERFKRSRFTPGLRGDRPVAAIMHIEVVF